MHRRYAQFQRPHGSGSHGGPTAWGSVPSAPYGYTSNEHAAVGVTTGGGQSSDSAKPSQGQSTPQTPGPDVDRPAPYADGGDKSNVGKYAFYGAGALAIAGIIYAVVSR